MGWYNALFIQNNSEGIGLFKIYDNELFRVRSSSTGRFFVQKSWCFCHPILSWILISCNQTLNLRFYLYYFHNFLSSKSRISNSSRSVMPRVPGSNCVSRKSGFSQEIFKFCSFSWYFETKFQNIGLGENQNSLLQMIDKLRHILAFGKPLTKNMSSNLRTYSTLAL